MHILTAFYLFTFTRGLANLLDRNIAVYEGQYTDGHLNLQRTGIIRNAKSADKMLTACSGTEEAERSLDQNDALYIGHITQDFYSSLRHVNWKDRFIDGREGSIDIFVDIKNIYCRQHYMISVISERMLIEHPMEV